MSKDYRKQVVVSGGDRMEDVACVNCKIETKHLVLAFVKVDGENWYGENCYQYQEEYQIIQCRGCETITYRDTSTNSEDFEWGPEGSTYIATTNLYPGRSVGRTPHKDAILLPLDIQRIYLETIKAMNNEQPVLAGVGIRAIVESICKNKQAAGGNLVAKIDALVPLGVLTLEGAKILHKLRTMGNDAAHEVKPHTMEQLALALNVCEHLFLGVYILPQQAEQMFAGKSVQP